METTLYYFSGTGNSLAVAKSITEKLDQCSLKPVVKAMEQKEFKVSAPRIGLIFPLYYIGIPKIVQEFIKQADFTEAKYIFVVVTKGWPVVGGAISQMKQLLKKKGKTLDAGMYIQMPMNDITMVTVATPKEQQQILAKAPRRITKITRIIETAKKHFDLEPLGFLWPARNIPFINRVNSDDKYFAANSNCNGCGSCEKICPMNNIRLVDKMPNWSGRCEACLACYHFCPKHSITFNKRGSEFQYHHPDIKMADMLHQK